MTLTDVYCRLNRARAIAGLISTGDLLNACKHLNKIPNAKIKYTLFFDEGKEENEQQETKEKATQKYGFSSSASSSLHVLEAVQSSRAYLPKLDEVCRLIDENQSLTPYGLGKLNNVNLIVAKKHLFDAEA